MYLRILRNFIWMSDFKSLFPFFKENGVFICPQKLYLEKGIRMYAGVTLCLELIFYIKYRSLSSV